MNVRSTSASDGSTDLEVMQQLVADKLGHLFVIIIFRNMTPLRFGFPINRPRFYIIGMLKPVPYTLAVCQQIAKTVIDKVSSSGGVVPNFLQFLGLAFAGCPVWERLHELPTLDELNEVPRCMCSLDPFAVCPQHPCKCGKCNKLAGGLPTCAWRQKAAAFIQVKLPHLSLAQEHGRITYIELIEFQTGQTTQSARERNLLNLLSYMDPDTPMQRSLAALDLSQSIDRTQYRSDGQLPTLATSSKVWAMRLGKTIDLKYLIPLCGLPFHADFGGQSPCSAMSMVGNSMHTSDLGVSLGIALLLKMGLLKP